MNPLLWRATIAAFFSGFAALVYQVVWSREFRHLFGASTAASGAVLAAFALGLGAGSLKLGKRADEHLRPFELYGRLEMAIALCAAFSPVSLYLVRKIYLATGGSLLLGTGLATALRIVLSVVVIGVPTFLMGGTLPALARAAIDANDTNRKGLGILYGVNTLGAVVGAFTTTFVTLETIGTRLTLWSACVINLMVALFAIRVGKVLANKTRVSFEGASTSGGSKVIYAAAGVTGFAFFLMELVWYRLLAPILGGTIFSFGLILSVALLGIGIGGSLYSPILGKREPRYEVFAFTCILEAFLIALPFGIGDHIAVLAVLLRPFGTYGFWGMVVGWSIVTSVVVLPAAIIAGIQFPLIIALLGSGDKNVGRQTSVAYVFNTVGATLGSIAGGFGMLPLLGASGCVRVAAGTLVAMGIAVFIRAKTRSIPFIVNTSLTTGLTVYLLGTSGPTAFWRHSPIGAGRIDPADMQNATDRKAYMRRQRSEVLAEREGVESAVAMVSSTGLAFVVNGKIDGNIQDDKGTQVGSGILGAMLHPEPKKALVIGLGTGSTAGWLGKVPTMEKVDVFELEPAILDVAKACAPANEAVLDNPKVKVHMGDARELLALVPDKYDVVFSEPSNPYRAGIASLYTQEYYRQVQERMAEDGVFLQWVQGYETDARTIRIIASTLQSVFPEIEIWELEVNDLLFVASKSARKYDAAKMRARLATEPFKKGFLAAWGVTELEGFFSHYVAQPSFVKGLAKLGIEPLNTDDACVVEFGFAKNVGQHGWFAGTEILELTRERKESLPVIEGPFDMQRMRYLRSVAPAVARRVAPRQGNTTTLPYPKRGEAFRAWAQDDPVNAWNAWQAGALEKPEGAAAAPVTPLAPQELLLLADTAVRLGRPEAAAHIRALAEVSPTNASALTTLAFFRAKDYPMALESFMATLRFVRADPWSEATLIRQFLRTGPMLAAAYPESASQLAKGLSEPFVVRLLEAERRQARVAIQQRMGATRECADAFAPYEPHAPWDEQLLALRSACYQTVNHPLAKIAAKELEEYQSYLPLPLSAGMRDPKKPKVDPDAVPTAHGPDALPAPSATPTGAPTASPTATGTAPAAPSGTASVKPLATARH